MRINNNVLLSAMDDAIFAALRPIVAKALEPKQLPGVTQDTQEEVTLDTELEVTGHGIELVSIVLDVDELFDIKLQEEEIWVKPYLKSKAYGADCITVRTIAAAVGRALIRKHT